MSQPAQLEAHLRSAQLGGRAKCLIWLLIDVSCPACAGPGGLVKVCILCSPQAGFYVIGLLQRESRWAEGMPSCL